MSWKYYSRWPHNITTHIIGSWLVETKNLKIRSNRMFHLINASLLLLLLLLCWECCCCCAWTCHESQQAYQMHFTKRLHEPSYCPHSAARWSRKTQTGRAHSPPRLSSQKVCTIESLVNLNVTVRTVRRAASTHSASSVVGVSRLRRLSYYDNSSFNVWFFTGINWRGHTARTEAHMALNRIKMSVSIRV